MPKSRNQVLFRRNPIPCQLRTPAPPFMLLPQSLSQSLFRNQAPSQSMPAWHFQKADTTDPGKGLSEGTWQSQTKHWAWPQVSSSYDTLHICAPLGSTPWWCHFHSISEVNKKAKCPRHLVRSAGHRPRTVFHLCGAAEQMENAHPARLDLPVSGSLLGLDNESKGREQHM